MHEKKRHETMQNLRRKISQHRKDYPRLASLNEPADRGKDRRPDVKPHTIWKANISPLTIRNTN